jgi:hypothetical protein
MLPCMMVAEFWEHNIYANEGSVVLSGFVSNDENWCCHSSTQTYDEKQSCQEPRAFVSFLPPRMLDFYFNQNMQSEYTENYFSTDKHLYIYDSISQDKSNAIILKRVSRHCNFKKM